LLESKYRKYIENEAGSGKWEVGSGKLNVLIFSLKCEKDEKLLSFVFSL